MGDGVPRSTGSEATSAAAALMAARHHGHDSAGIDALWGAAASRPEMMGVGDVGVTLDDVHRATTFQTEPTHAVAAYPAAYTRINAAEDRESSAALLALAQAPRVTTHPPSTQHEQQFGYHQFHQQGYQEQQRFQEHQRQLELQRRQQQQQQQTGLQPQPQQRRLQQQYQQRQPSAQQPPPQSVRPPQNRSQLPTQPSREQHTLPPAQRLKQEKWPRQKKPKPSRKRKEPTDYSREIDAIVARAEQHPEFAKPLYTTTQLNHFVDTSNQDEVLGRRNTSAVVRPGQSIVPKPYQRRPIDIDPRLRAMPGVNGLFLGDAFQHARPLPVPQSVSAPGVSTSANQATTRRFPHPAFPSATGQSNLSSSAWSQQHQGRSGDRPPSHRHSRQEAMHGEYHGYRALQPPQPQQQRTELIRATSRGDVNAAKNFHQPTQRLTDNLKSVIKNDINDGAAQQMPHQRHFSARNDRTRILDRPSFSLGVSPTVKLMQPTHSHVHASQHYYMESPHHQLKTDRKFAGAVWTDEEHASVVARWIDSTFQAKPIANVSSSTNARSGASSFNEASILPSLDFRSIKQSDWYYPTPEKEKTTKSKAFNDAAGRNPYMKNSAEPLNCLRGSAAVIGESKNPVERVFTNGEWQSFSGTSVPSTHANPGAHTSVDTTRSRELSGESKKVGSFASGMEMNMMNGHLETKGGKPVSNNRLRKMEKQNRRHQRRETALKEARKQPDMNTIAPSHPLLRLGHNIPPGEQVRPRNPVQREQESLLRQAHLAMIAQQQLHQRNHGGINPSTRPLPIVVARSATAGDGSVLHKRSRGEFGQQQLLAFSGLYPLPQAWSVLRGADGRVETPFEPYVDSKVDRDERLSQIDNCSAPGPNAQGVSDMKGGGEKVGSLPGEDSLSSTLSACNSEAPGLPGTAPSAIKEKPTRPRKRKASAQPTMVRGHDVLALTSIGTHATDDGTKPQTTEHQPQSTNKVVTTTTSAPILREGMGETHTAVGLGRPETDTVMIFCKRDFLRYQAGLLWKKYQEVKRKRDLTLATVTSRRARYMSGRYNSSEGKSGNSRAHRKQRRNQSDLSNTAGSPLANPAEMIDVVDDDESVIDEVVSESVVDNGFVTEPLKLSDATDEQESGVADIDSRNSCCDQVGDISAEPELENCCQATPKEHMKPQPSDEGHAERDGHEESEGTDSTGYDYPSTALPKSHNELQIQEHDKSSHDDEVDYADPARSATHEHRPSERPEQDGRDNPTAVQQAPLDELAPTEDDISLDVSNAENELSWSDLITHSDGNSVHVGEQLGDAFGASTNSDTGASATVPVDSCDVSPSSHQADELACSTSNGQQGSHTEGITAGKDPACLEEAVITDQSQVSPHQIAVVGREDGEPEQVDTPSQTHRNNMIGETSPEGHPTGDTQIPVSTRLEGEGRNGEEKAQRVNTPQTILGTPKVFADDDSEFVIIEEDTFGVWTSTIVQDSSTTPAKAPLLEDFSVCATEATEASEASAVKEQEEASVKIGKQVNGVMESLGVPSSSQHNVSSDPFSGTSMENSQSSPLCGTSCGVNDAAIQKASTAAEINSTTHEVTTGYREECLI